MRVHTLRIKAVENCRQIPRSWDDDLEAAPALAPTSGGQKTGHQWLMPANAVVSCRCGRRHDGDPHHLAGRIGVRLLSLNGKQLATVFRIKALKCLRCCECPFLDLGRASVRVLCGFGEADHPAPDSNDQFSSNATVPKPPSAHMLTMARLPCGMAASSFTA